MLARWAAARLEAGRFDSPPARAAARLWSALAEPVRPVELPAGCHVVGVGGATLGGSGKTPLVEALARALEHAGRGVAVVASGYRAKRRLGRVRRDDPVGEVGDEALMLARALEAPVVVGRERGAALRLAAELARNRAADTPIVLVDGLLQAWPRPLGCSVLVLDADRPWGAGRCPPWGDLRAARGRLLAAADLVVLVGEADRRAPPGLPCFRCEPELVGARTPEGELVPVEQLRGMRLGVTLALARPERVLAELHRHGVDPARVLLAADHARPRLASGAQAWLTTAKGATKLPGSGVWVLERRLRVPGALIGAIQGQQGA